MFKKNIDYKICILLTYLSSDVYTTIVVSVDLLSEQFIPGKKSYERTKQCLEKLPNFDMIFIWEPPKNDICPSSLAKYFHDLDYKVKLCKPSFASRMELGARVPVIDESVDMYDFVEWIGMLSLDADLKNGSPDSYLNTYFVPEPNEYCKNVKYMEWRGFFTSARIQKIIRDLGLYIQEEGKPWATIFVQGFSDSPINWKENEHHFYTNGDNGYLILIKPDQTYNMVTSATSMKQYK